MSNKAHRIIQVKFETVMTKCGYRLHMSHFSPAQFIGQYETHPMNQHKWQKITLFQAHKISNWGIILRELKTTVKCHPTNPTHVSSHASQVYEATACHLEWIAYWTKSKCIRGDMGKKYKSQRPWTLFGDIFYCGIGWHCEMWCAAHASLPCMFFLVTYSIAL